jgi:hypothetical protein
MNAAAPNPLTPELYNLIVLIVCCLLLAWLIRLCRSSFSLAQLAWALRTNRFNIINIADFDRIDTIWGEGSIRSYIQALFGGRVKSPARSLKRINGVLHIHKNSLKIARVEVPSLQSQKEFKNGIEFKFDSLVNCSVQLFFGVAEHAFNEKVLLPFKREYDRQMANTLQLGTSVQSNTTFRRTSKVDTVDPENDRQSLLASESIVDDDTHINVEQKDVVDLDINIEELLNTDEYTFKTNVIQFPPGLGSRFLTPTDHMVTDNQAERYFTSLPLTHRRIAIPTATQLNTTTETNVQTNVELQEVNVQGSEYSTEEGNDKDEEGVVDDTVGSDIRLPLVIVVRSTSSSASFSSIKRNITKDNSTIEDNDFDDEIVCTYLIANFHKHQQQPNPESGDQRTQYFTIKPVKMFVQTHSELYEVQDIYGTSDDPQQQESECVICLSEERDVTLLPCRHQCVCKTCFQHIDKCPVCRANIREYISSVNVEGDIADQMSQQYVDRLIGA